MAKKNSLTFLFLIFCLSLLGNPYIDSLKQVERTAKHDSIRLNALRELGRAYVDSNFTKSLHYFNSALQIATKLRDRINMAYAHQTSGLVYFNMGEFNEAINQYNNALSIYLYIDKTKGVADVYNDIGLIYKTMGKYAQAIENYSLALSKYEILKDKHGIGMVANNIGQIYFYRDDYQNAIQYFSKYLNISKDLNKQIDVAGASNNIAAAYIELNNYDKAYEHYQTALLIYDSLNIKSGVAILNDNIGSLFAKSSNYAKALDHHLYALSIFKAINSKTRMAYNLKNIGFVYLKLQKYNQAIDYFQQSKTLAIEYSQLETLKEVYFFLEEAYASQHKYFEALASYKLFVQIQDSLKSQETGELLANLELQHESDKKTRDLEYFQAKIEQQKMFNLTVASIGLVFFLFLLVFAWDNLNKRKSLKRLLIQKKILNEELNYSVSNTPNTNNYNAPFKIKIISNRTSLTSSLNYFHIESQRYYVIVTIAFNQNFDEIGIVISALKKHLHNQIKNNVSVSQETLLDDCSRIFNDYKKTFSINSEPIFNLLVFDVSDRKVFTHTQSLAWIVSNEEVKELPNRTALTPMDSVSQVFVFVGENSRNFNHSSNELTAHLSKAVDSIKNNSFNNQIEILKSSIDFWQDSFQNKQNFFILAVNVSAINDF
jgi:tetratricopeptide (TPR) repeat protein